MVAWGWKTRAALVLHVSTILQAVYGLVRCCFEATNPRTCLNRRCAFPVYERDILAPDHRIDVFTCVKLSFGHSQLAATKARTTLSSDRSLAMAKEFFGTDGIRGVPGTPPLDDATLYATGRALGAYLKREHGAAHVLIGMDTRESGPHIASLLRAGLAQGGRTVAFAGRDTPSGVALRVLQEDFQAAA